MLKFLTHNVPWYGPLYLAHTKLENDYGSPDEAFSIVEKGLKELPRYGPLYFQAFKQLEKEDLQEKADKAALDARDLEASEAFPIRVKKAPMEPSREEMAEHEILH